MNITKDFTKFELIDSPTAREQKIDNTPTPEAMQALTSLAEDVLQPARDALGVPILVSSGYRSPELNRAVGGSPTSQHMRGEAVDVRCASGADTARLFFYLLERGGFDQLIWENGTDLAPHWIHVSYKRGGGNRGQAFRLRYGRRLPAPTAPRGRK